MKQVTIVVGIENYPPKVNPTKWAENDATEFAKALQLHGVQATILLGNAATKTAIEAHVRKAVKDFDKEDRFFFFFSGHGFSKRGKNYLMTSDFMNDDPV